jgi:membrane fusion protein (multidrug efflux system)
VFDALGDREFPGILSQIVPQSAEGTHTVPVRVDVANTVQNSRPLIAAGLFAKVWVPVGAEHQALLVPKAAVIRQEGRDFVYTVADAPPAGAGPPGAGPPSGGSESAKGAKTDAPPAAAGPQSPPPSPAIVQAGPIRFAVAIPVRIVQGHGRYMEVQSDRLQAGMMLVTRGTYQMAPGTPVWVRPKEQAGEAPAAPTAGADAAGKAK